MSKERRIPSERTVKHEMKRQGREPFFTADNMTYFHQVVIHYICKMIGGHPVRLEQHFVVKGLCVYYYVPSYQIIKMNIFIRRHLIAYNIWFPPVHPVVPFNIIQGE